MGHDAHQLQEVQQHRLSQSFQLERPVNVLSILVCFAENAQSLDPSGFEALEFFVKLCDAKVSKKLRGGRLLASTHSLGFPK